MLSDTSVQLLLKPLVIMHAYEAAKMCLFKIIIIKILQLLKN